ncbi:MAG TPA: MarP family serine protease [Jatrophihabitantaceae bacterium]|nr:MarP family serine protease [Jatrophihabitantaceae bacterium]
MNVLDVIIVLAAIAFGIGGFRNGAIVGVCSLLGFFGGAVVGAQLAKPIGSHVANGRAQIPVAIVCVLFVAMIGQLLGVYIAGHIRHRVVGERTRKLDAGVGSALGVFSVLLVAWMVAIPLAHSPYPELSAAATHSRIVRGVNSVVPNDVRSLYSSLRQFLDQSGFPPVLGDLPDTDIVEVAPPDPQLSPALRARVRTASASVYKVLGEAPSCSRGIEGSGFVFAPHRIVTNAHVVAGTSQIGVQASTGGNVLPATVVVFDPRRDVAVLSVPDVDAPALRLAPADARTGDPAVVLGYPGDGQFTAKSARVRSHTTITGNDIYGHSSVRRDIYAIRAVVRAGNSGGPLLSASGRALGVVFATALDSSDTGYVLSVEEIAPDIAKGRTASAKVSTGRCTPE